MDRKTDLLKRVYLVMAVFILVGVFLFARVYKISIIEGDKWRAQGDSLYLKFFDIEAERGNILSDDGSFLATSIQFFDIRVDLNSSGMKTSDFEDNIDSLAICLSKYVDPTRTSVQWKNFLIQQKKAGSRWTLIKTKATYKEMEMIKKFPLLRLGHNKGGLILEKRIERQKPFKHLANRTIGEYRNNAQMVGLEGYYDQYLKGEQGKIARYKTGVNTWLPANDLTEILPRSGSDIHTTLNIGIQDVAHSSLLNALEYHQADNGVAIVMEVETGAIKAIVNLRKSSNGGYAEIYNDAVGSAIEPGSTMKLATMMALLEDQKVDLDESVLLGYGQGQFCNRIIHDSEPHEFKETTARHAFEISSNVGMARLVTDKYKKSHEEAKFIARLRQFHLDKSTGIEIKGEADPFIKDAYATKDKWSCLSLPWMSFGYELSMTPLQIANFYNAVANNGRMMKPYLVSKIQKGTKIEQQFSPVVLDDAIASQATIQAAHRLLEGVMLNGTGRKIKLPFAVAGKTGTSQTNYSDKSASRTKYQSSFAGYFPANNPKYTCLVMVNNPTKNGFYGSKVAGPVFREIALKCMNRIPEYVESEIETSNSIPKYRRGYNLDYENILTQLNMPYNSIHGSEFSILTSTNDTLELKGQATSNEKVPNVESMTLRDALYLLENKGYEVVSSGLGRVVDQIPKPGEYAKENRIQITLK